MAATILFGALAVLMFIGTPIAFCLGVASFLTVLYLGLPPLVVFQRLNSGMSVFTLLAIPFFIYAGDLMVRGGIAQRIVSFAGSLVGHLRGGLGQVNIIASTMFGGISGSAVAEAAAVGGLMIPQMKARGYGTDYAVNDTSMAALIALLLPPSHNMIIYSIAGGGRISIADLFTAGIIPGLMFAAALMITAYFVARSTLATFHSTTSSEASRPLSAIISMHSCISRYVGPPRTPVPTPGASMGSRQSRSKLTWMCVSSSTSCSTTGPVPERGRPRFARTTISRIR